MKLKDLVSECSKITKSKGFDVSRYPEQLMLIATECSEAIGSLALVPINANKLRELVQQFRKVMDDFEYFRREEVHEPVMFEVADPENLLEELADIQIRLCSFIGGNNLTCDFMDALKSKMEKNRNRPYLHGKNF